MICAEFKIIIEGFCYKKYFRCYIIEAQQAQKIIIFFFIYMKISVEGISCPALKSCILYGAATYDHTARDVE
jgi:hypothetical protein